MCLTPCASVLRCGVLVHVGGYIVLLHEHAAECSPEDVKALVRELSVIKWVLIGFVSSAILKIASQL